MKNIVGLKRYFEQRFFQSANDKNGFQSISETFGKIVVAHILGLDEARILRGDPLKNEPDFLFDVSNGLEITFASNRNSIMGSSIARLHEDYQISSLEDDLIESITNSISEKEQKKTNGNYSSVTDVTLLVLCIEPLLFWYGYLHNFNHSHTLRKRDSFFDSLYKTYISTGIFKNIYILQMTEFKTYIFYDLLKFSQSDSDYITELSSTNFTHLPYCEITKNEIIPGEPFSISYQYENIIIR